MTTDQQSGILAVDPGGLTVVSCAALRREAPRRVRLFSTASQLATYMVDNVLFLGNPSQALCPVGENGQPLYLLEESWTYSLGDFPQATTYSLAHSSGGACRVLELATPLCFVWAGNFWHWVFEGLSRVAVLESLGFKGVYIIPSKNDRVLETMQLMGIAQERIVYGQQPYFVKRMLVTAHMPPDKYTPATLEALRALRGCFEKAIPRLPGSKRCYVKRIGKRKVSNEHDVIAMLQPMGFEVLVPEEQPSVVSQFMYMSNVECAVMPHGANCTLAFAQPANAHLFELFGMGYVNNCNGPMVDAAGLHHHQLCEKTTPDVCYSGSGDYAVDTDFLRHRLKKVLDG